MNLQGRLLSMEEIGFRELRQTLRPTFDRVAAGPPIVVTFVNRPLGVLMSVDEYRRLAELSDRDLAVEAECRRLNDLSDHDLAAEVARNLRAEVAQGQGSS